MKWLYKVQNSSIQHSLTKQKMSLYFLNKSVLVLCFHKALHPLVKLMCIRHILSLSFTCAFLLPVGSIAFSSILWLIHTEDYDNKKYLWGNLWHNDHSFTAQWSFQYSFSTSRILHLIYNILQLCDDLIFFPMWK